MTAHVQDRFNHSSGAVASFGLAFSSAVTAGNTLVAVVGTVNTGVTFTVADNVNGNWPAALASTSTGRTIFFFALPATLAGTPTVTATLGTGTAGISMSIIEVSGISGALDQAATFTTVGAGATSSSVGPTAAQTQANDFAVAATQLSSNGSAWAAGGSYTLVGTPVAFGASWFVVPDTSAQTATFTWTTALGYASGLITLSPGQSAIAGLTNQSSTFTEGSITATAVNGTAASQAGGTGASKRKIKRSREIFEEEMARLERQAEEATAQRVEVEEKLSTSSPYEPVPEDIRRYIVNFERALRRAQSQETREKHIEVPVYLRIPAKSAGVERLEAYQRLQSLAKIARFREERAQERLRKVRDKIDSEAAVYFMNFILWDD